MELAQTLILVRFDMEKFFPSFREKIIAKIRGEKIQQTYRYEGTAQIKDRDSVCYVENDFTL